MKPSSNDDSHKEQLAGDYRDLAAAFSAQGDVVRTLKCLYDELAVRQQLAAAHPESALHLFWLARSYEDIGKLLLKQGEWDRSLSALSENLAVMERTASLQPGNDLWEAKLGHAYGLVGVALAKLGQRIEARENLLKGRDTIERLRNSHERFAESLAWCDQELSLI